LVELSESATSAANISTWFDVEDGVVGTVGAGSTAQMKILVMIGIDVQFPLHQLLQE
jgi:hypothetical protein